MDREQREQKFYAQFTPTRQIGLGLITAIALVAGRELGIFYDISVMMTWMAYFPELAKPAGALYIGVLTIAALAVLWSLASGRMYYKLLFAAVLLSPLAAVFTRAYNALVQIGVGNFWEITVSPMIYVGALALALVTLWRMAPAAPATAVVTATDADTATAESQPATPAA